MNIELSRRECELILGMIEREYYHARDTGYTQRRDELIALEHKFTESNKNAAEISDPSPDGEIRAWFVGDLIKCMSQMCVGVDGVKCPHYDDCAIVEVEMVDEDEDSDEGGE